MDVEGDIDPDLIVVVVFIELFSTRIVLVTIKVWCLAVRFCDAQCSQLTKEAEEPGRDG